MGPNIPVGTNRTLGRRRVLRLMRTGLLVLGVVAGCLAVISTPASAAGPPGATIFRNWATGECLDSNYAGAVYPLGCNGGNYQNWFLYDTGWVEASTNAPIIYIWNAQTGRCLDSNTSGNVYTNPCAPVGSNYFQFWVWYGDAYVGQYQDGATGLLLQANGGGIYTQVCCSNFQDWRQGF